MIKPTFLLEQPQEEIDRQSASIGRVLDELLQALLVTVEGVQPRVLERPDELGDRCRCVHSY